LYIGVYMPVFGLKPACSKLREMRPLLPVQVTPYDPGN